MFDKEFQEQPDEIIFQTILAANFLDIKNLLELMCKKVSPVPICAGFVSSVAFSFLRFYWVKNPALISLNGVTTILVMLFVTWCYCVSSVLLSRTSLCGNFGHNSSCIQHVASIPVGFQSDSFPLKEF